MSERLRRGLKADYAKRVDDKFESYRKIILKAKDDIIFRIPLHDTISIDQAVDLENLDFLKYKGEKTFDKDTYAIFELTSTGEELATVMKIEKDLEKDEIALSSLNDDVFVLKTIVMINNPASMQIARGHDVFHYIEDGKPIYATYCTINKIWENAERLKEARKELEEAIDIHEELHV